MKQWQNTRCVVGWLIPATLYSLIYPRQELLPCLSLPI